MKTYMGVPPHSLTNHPEIYDWRKYQKRPVVVSAKQQDEPFRVSTLEGMMEGAPGDFIICGIKGELYPCKPDIFNETYYDYERPESKSRKLIDSSDIVFLGVLGVLSALFSLLLLAGWWL